ncbi:hypothetical protein CEXT_618911 [Caerostris extrusa]|uniref:Uncharacterized protein n=1 Tax=Caerostris extrusa TaxID=172846 RepID=A0AAV4T3D8_CAEEX|nr:hypothetical protein CEXT_618911 [Caerostris extrusa]
MGFVGCDTMLGFALSSLDQIVLIYNCLIDLKPDIEGNSIEFNQAHQHLFLILFSLIFFVSKIRLLSGNQGTNPKLPTPQAAQNRTAAHLTKNDRRPSSSDNHHGGPHSGHHSLNLDSDTAPLGCCSSDSSNGMFSSSEITKLSPTHPAFVSAGPTQGSTGAGAGHSAAALAAAAAAGFPLRSHR